MEHAEISRHQVLIARVLQAHPGVWMTNQDIAAEVPSIASRTVRVHTRNLVQLGLIDQAEVFPAHRYRWSAMSEKRNPAYSLRLSQAADVFGI